jgi:LysR family nod box-dependent transcriptional activator
MDFSGIDLNLLVALDALIAERSVSRAGERLHLSQSATSGALARLRDAFHDPLLVQVGRTMALTPLAESLVEPVREFLLQAELILRHSPVFDPATSTRRFRMMMSDYVETVIMSEALPKLQKIAPGVTFELFSNDNTNAIDRGEIDLSITPSRYLAEGHPSEHLFDDDYVCVAWAGNPHVHRNISIEQYLSLGHVIVRYGNQRQLPAFDEWFLERGDYQRRIEVITTAFNLVPQLLLGTARIATLHRRLYRFYRRYFPIRAVPAPLEIPRIEEFLQWHRSRDRDPGTVWLRAVLKQLVAKGLSTETAMPRSKAHGSRRTPAGAAPNAAHLNAAIAERKK